MIEIKLKPEDEKKVIDFCALNSLINDEFVYLCFKKGFDIERYGLLGLNEEKNCDSELSDLNDKLTSCNKKRKALEETLSELKLQIAKHKKDG